MAVAQNMDAKLRSKNFTETEKETLIEVVNRYKDIIECKKTDGCSAPKKTTTWDKIAQEFNATSGYVARDETN